MSPGGALRERPQHCAGAHLSNIHQSLRDSLPLLPFVARAATTAFLESTSCHRLPPLPPTLGKPAPQAAVAKTPNIFNRPSSAFPRLAFDLGSRTNEAFPSYVNLRRKKVCQLPTKFSSPGNPTLRTRAPVFKPSDPREIDKGPRGGSRRAFYSRKKKRFTTEQKNAVKSEINTATTYEV